MDAINPPTHQLQYAPPVAATDREAVRSAGEFRFDLGPEPSTLFIARILPWCLLVGLAAGACFWSAAARRGLFPGIGLWMMMLTAAAITLWRLARYRHVPRTVGVADGQVFYADARTRGQPFGVPPAEVRALRVQQRWWRPCVFELTTVPGLILGIGTTHPVVLAYSLDRGSLDRLCRELTAALSESKGEGRIERGMKVRCAPLATVGPHREGVPMDAVNPPRNQLDYAPPLRPNDVDIRRADDGIDILVGPMPASVFVTAILPHAFLLAAVAVLVGWTFYPARRAVAHDLLLIGLVTGVSVLGAAVNVAVLLRHRLVPRALGASPGSIYFSDARTGGKPRRFVAADISAIGVRRRWWCPWILELVAVPRYQLLAFRKQTTAPIVLIAGLDRATLQQVASYLREVLKSRSAARNDVSTPVPPTT